MRCAEFESRLQDVLDERGQPELDPALAAHFEHCASRAAKLAVYETMWEGLTLSAPRLSAEFGLRLSRNVIELNRAELAKVEAPPRRPLLVSSGWLAIAAALLVGLVSLLRPSANVVQGPSGPVVPPQQTAIVQVQKSERAVPTDGAAPTDNPATVENSVRIEDNLPVENSVPTTNAVASENALAIDNPLASLPVSLRRQPMADVAKETGQGLAVAFLAIPGVGSGNLGSQPAWMSDVSDGLAPVTQSMTGALNVLLRAIPSAGPTVRDPSAS